MAHAGQAALNDISNTPEAETVGRDQYNGPRHDGAQGQITRLEHQVASLRAENQKLREILCAVRIVVGNS